MYTLNICLVFLLSNFHVITCKIYVVDLTNSASDVAKKIELQDLIDILKPPDELKQTKFERNVEEDKEVDCLVSLVTPNKKVRCLEGSSRKRKSVRRVPLYYQEYSQRPKRTVLSLYNYYGGLINSEQPFTDITRQEFSQDYLDVGDLSRVEPGCRHSECSGGFSDNYKNKLRIRVSNKPESRRRNVGTMRADTSSEESDSSDSNDSNDSDTDLTLRKDKNRNKKNRKDRNHRKPNRFQVVFNEDSSASEEQKPRRKPVKSSLESEEIQKKKPVSDSSLSESVEVTKPLKLKEKYSYLQGNKLYDSFRRRLPHFLPKRLHWDEDELKNLGYYWYDGTRGKYYT